MVSLGAGGARGRGTACGPGAGQLDAPMERQEGSVAGAQRTEGTKEISKVGVSNLARSCAPMHSRQGARESRRIHL